MESENVLVAVHFRVIQTHEYLSEAMLDAYKSALWVAMRSKPVMEAVIWERELRRYFTHWGVVNGVDMYRPNEPLLLVTFNPIADSYTRASSPLDEMEKELGQGEVYAKDFPRLWDLGRDVVSKSEAGEAQIVCLYRYELKLAYGGTPLNGAIPYEDIELAGRVDLSRVPVLERTE